MKILVTGGMGYVGSTLVDMLLETTDHHITILDRLDYPVDGGFLNKIITNNRVNFIRGDIKDIGKTYPLINEADAVVHMAAIVGESRCHKYPQESVLTNEIGSKNIVNTCNELNKHLILLSTASNYGKSSKLVNEDGDLLPVSLYAITKVNTEKYIIRNNIPVIILRCGTAFGYSPARTRFDLMINEWIKNRVLGDKVEVFEPNAWRPFCHVKDMSRSVIMALEKKVYGTKVINILGFNIQKIKLANNIINDKTKIKIVNRGDMRDYRIDGSEARRWLGFEPQFGVDHAIKELTEKINNRQVDITTSNV